MEHINGFKAAVAAVLGGLTALSTQIFSRWSL